ncbi:unnamed protein product [Ixodes hexagonus]
MLLNLRGVLVSSCVLWCVSRCDGVGKAATAKLESRLEEDAIELDLLKMLNISDSQKGVGQTTGPIADLPAWKLFSGLNAVQLPLEPEEKFRDHLVSSNALSAIFVAKPNRRTVATLFSVHLPGKMSPLLRVAVNFRTRRFVLSYTVPDEVRKSGTSVSKAPEVPELDFGDGSHYGLADGADELEQTVDVEGFQLNSANVRHVKFKLASAGTTKKKSLGWVWVGVTVTPERVTLYENCEEPVSAELAMSPLLRFPSDALVYFRQEPGLKRKFVGSVQVARMYSGHFLSRPWVCDRDLQPSLHI